MAGQRFEVLANLQRVALVVVVGGAELVAAARAAND
jgi:hypothetical protein